MFKKQRQVKVNAAADKQPSIKDRQLEVLTSQKLSFIMQFGNYYPGFSPEWELFR